MKAAERWAGKMNDMIRDYRRAPSWQNITSILVWSQNDASMGGASRWNSEKISHRVSSIRADGDVGQLRGGELAHQQLHSSDNVMLKSIAGMT